MSIHVLRAVLVLALIVGLLGCGSDEPKQASAPPPPKRPQTIDLDKVLKIFGDTLDEQDLNSVANATPQELEAMASAGSDAAAKKAKLTGKLDKGKEEQFVKSFSQNLNKAKLMPEPIGAAILDDGTIQGFSDPNRNNVKDGKSEKELFRIQLDEKRGRVIASDTANNYNRDRHYGFSTGGFLTGYLLGSMMHRQQASGFDTSKFSSTQMSPAGYHGQAMKQGMPGAATGAGSPPKTGSTSTRASIPGAGGGAGTPPTTTTGKPTAPAPTASSGAGKAAVSTGSPATSSPSGSARTSGGSRGFSGGK